MVAFLRARRAAKFQNRRRSYLQETLQVKWSFQAANMLNLGTGNEKRDTNTSIEMTSFYWLTLFSMVP